MPEDEPCDELVMLLVHGEPATDEEVARWEEAEACRAEMDDTEHL